ncbi:uncharacterized protein K452DRAFT_325410 [Aplosporella prunicola CBS 121167]|uniref:Zinc/iron permease n=1 Tax=Aplosporella prunicola CBS 121167 TaxID=1176127 RepID=A0A6A6BJ36_9PEZI|nr:uncharacterized protein K452DRAFT_325410 [Aplosporella prunicola CBS 121167]KAF2144162.1 hypothetical protein K452DRAFT_325410 [Aplosporella prunicola CBS 121167]
MWSGSLLLLILSTIMGISSFLAGSLPLSFTLSQRHLRYISALGSGVLVGTSLIVIVPEGIETLYTAYADDSHHARRHLDTSTTWSHPVPRAEPPANNDDDSGDDRAQVGRPAGDEYKHKTHREPHAWVGVSLIFGFILMYLIDMLPTVLTATTARPLHISLSNLSSGLHHSPSHSPSLYAADSAPSDPASNAPATTIGLVIHAAADGIALGASGATPSGKLGLIIFIAIMVHKAPAAFGLTSVLLKQGLSKRQARAHLLFFSLAAPVGALSTWAVVNLLGREALGGAEGMQFATGCVLLFSGGTFLYVAMHSMQEITGGGSHANPAPTTYGRVRAGSGSSALANGYVENGLLDPSYGDHPKAPSVAEVCVAVLGMLVPLLTQVGHGGHGH